MVRLNLNWKCAQDSAVKASAESFERFPLVLFFHKLRPLHSLVYDEIEKIMWERHRADKENLRTIDRMENAYFHETIKIIFFLFHNPRVVSSWIIELKYLLYRPLHNTHNSLLAHSSCNSIPVEWTKFKCSTNCWILSADHKSLSCWICWTNCIELNFLTRSELLCTLPPSFPIQLPARSPNFKHSNTIKENQ